MLLKEDSVTKETTLDKFFSDKKMSVRATVKSLLDEILLRERIDLHILKKINREIIVLDTEILQTRNIISIPFLSLNRLYDKHRECLQVFLIGICQTRF